MTRSRTAGSSGTQAKAGEARWWLGETRAPSAVVLIRLVVGGIFGSEGVQKFVFPAELGPGRFAKQTPLPAPEVFAYLTGGVEIVCGVLLVLGLLTRPARVPLISVMVGAEVFTKFPLAAREGFWAYAHEARTELGQLFGLLFLLAVGAGPWSLDHRLAHARAAAASHSEEPVTER